MVGVEVSLEVRLRIHSTEKWMMLRLNESDALVGSRILMTRFLNASGSWV